MKEEWEEKTPSLSLGSSDSREERLLQELSVSLFLLSFLSLYIPFFFHSLTSFLNFYFQACDVQRGYSLRKMDTCCRLCKPGSSTVTILHMFYKQRCSHTGFHESRIFNSMHEPVFVKTCRYTSMDFQYRVKVMSCCRILCLCFLLFIVPLLPLCKHEL